MIRSVRVRAMLLCGVTAVCAAQVYTPPPPPLTTLPPCPAERSAKKRAKRKDCDPTVYPSETVETKSKRPGDAAPAVAPPAGGTAADKYPFPGEQPAAGASAAKRFPYPGADPSGEDTVNVPHDPEAEKKASQTTAAKSYPYPGDANHPGDLNPGAADRGVTPGSGATAPKPDRSASESSSSSSSTGDGAVAGDAGGGSKSAAAKNPDDDDEDQPKLKDKGSEGRRTKKVVKPQTDTERVDEDLSVAKFYGQSGNYMGAYLRARDAVKTQPEFAEGHFALGEAAKRLKKKDEAVAEFQTYLKLAPDGDKAKAAEKALDELR